jgi:threonine dehydrogenase-like Zn-dependent dehydrogenase
VKALVSTPGTGGSTRVEDVSDPRPAPGEVLLRPLEVGVCGTDREIAEGLFGEAPEGEDALVHGHELLAVVEHDGEGFARGDLVAATVRRSCGHCPACAAGSPDACETGDYLERGITRLHGFASELACEHAENVVAIPESVGRLGVLGEPASICERGLRHVRAIGARQPWTASRALVTGTGAIGMLATYLLRLEGYDVWTAGMRPGGEKPALVAASGARYVALEETTLEAVAEDAGGFDVVVAAAGDAQQMLETVGVLRRNGVACLLGLDGRPRQVCLDGHVLGVDAVIQNRAVFGSVNAHRDDWEAGVVHLGEARRRWPDALEAFVGLRAGLDDFAEAFGFRGVKATLELSPAGR